MASSPMLQAKPQLKLTFHMPTGGLIQKPDIAFISAEYKAEVNAGYVFRATLLDPYHALLNQMVEDGYFQLDKRSPIYVDFQILAGPKGTPPETATDPMTGIITTLVGYGKDYYDSSLEFTCIDPASWFLNIGDASGRAWHGNVGSVIQQVVEYYTAAGNVAVDVGITMDSEQNTFWQMRQDPKTFVNTLIDYSASMTPGQTNWIVDSGADPDNGSSISIKELSQLKSVYRAYYRYRKGGVSHVHSWRVVGDNALSLLNTKIITAGMSAISGQYLDKIQYEENVTADDSTTPNKQFVDTEDGETFEIPPDDWTPVSGFTQVPGLPELYSAGDCGLYYQDYIDGCPRGMYLNQLQSLFRLQLTVLGHGEWSSCTGLGIDTIYVDWKTATGEEYFLGRRWLVYGFHHHVTKREWLTDLYCSRFYKDAQGTPVGGGDYPTDDGTSQYTGNIA